MIKRYRGRGSQSGCGNSLPKTKEFRRDFCAPTWRRLRQSSEICTKAPAYSCCQMAFSFPEPWSFWPAPRIESSGQDKYFVVFRSTAKPQSLRTFRATLSFPIWFFCISFGRSKQVLVAGRKGSRLEREWWYDWKWWRGTTTRSEKIEIQKQENLQQWAEPGVHYGLLAEPRNGCSLQPMDLLSLEIVFTECWIQEGGSVSIVFPYSPTTDSSLPVWRHIATGHSFGWLG